MRKSFTKKVFKTAVVAVTLSFAWGLGGCSNSIDVCDASTSDSSNSQLAVLEEKKEELALYAMNGQFIASESELEGSVRAFISNSDSNSSSSRSLMSSSEISKVKMDSIAIATTSANSARTVVEDFSEEIPIYYYEITIGDRTDVVIATPDRRVGNILAYIEDCSVENLADDADSPVSVFFDNLSGYVQAIADLWNNELTDSYLESVRSAAESVVKSGEYTYSDWVYNGGNEKCVIPSCISKYTGQSTFLDIGNCNLNYTLHGCGATSAMQIQCFHKHPKRITVDTVDFDGTNYNGSLIWSNYSDENMKWLNTEESTIGSNWANAKIKYYNKGAADVFAEEFDYFRENYESISMTDLKNRYEVLKNQESSKVQAATATWNKNKNILFYWISKSELEGRYNTYSRLRNKANTSVANMEKFFVDNVKKSEKKVAETSTIVDVNFYKGICALFYQTMIGCKSVPNYDSSGNNESTSTYSADCISYMKSVGFSMEDECDYSYSKVKQSIDNGCPLIVTGHTGEYENEKGEITHSGHSWIIDGYANLSCTAKNTSTKESMSLTADYVHCNWGWNGIRHGFYLSGVFDSRENPLYTGSYDSAKQRSVCFGEESNKSGYFQHYVKIVPNIKPSN